MKSIFLFLILISSSLVLCQEGNFSLSLKNNNIHSIEGYIYTDVSIKDSILLSKEFFNREGFRIKLEIYDSTNTNIYTFRYFYRQDSIQTAFLTYKEDRMTTKTTYILNRNNKRIQSTVYYGNQVNDFTIYLFNKDQRIIEIKQYRNNILKLLTEYKYYNFGALREKIIKYPKLKRSVTRFKKTRAEVNLFSKTYKKYDNYKNSHKDLIKTTHSFNRKGEFSTILGVMNFEKRDELKTKAYYLDNGLLEYVIQTKNDAFLVKKIYLYNKF